MSEPSKPSLYDSVSYVPPAGPERAQQVSRTSSRQWGGMPDARKVAGLPDAPIQARTRQGSRTGSRQTEAKPASGDRIVGIRRETDAELLRRSGQLPLAGAAFVPNQPYWPIERETTLNEGGDYRVSTHDSENRVVPTLVSYGTSMRMAGGRRRQGARGSSTGGGGIGEGSAMHVV